MRVSTIVCTRNRAAALGPCLESIATAIYTSTDMIIDLIVVDNGSTDDTAQRVKEWAKIQNFGVQLLFEGRRGLSAARNCGLAEASGDYVVFTDDDCRLSPTYFRDFFKYFSKDSHPVLRGGRVELGDPSDLPLSIKTNALPQEWRLAEGTANQVNLGDSLVGCNMAMSKKLAQTLGLFDERLGAGSAIPGGEDTDYIMRAYLAGFTVSYVPDMSVTHLHGRKLPSEGRKLFINYANGWGALYAKYLFKSPGMCRPFIWDLKNALSEMISRKNTFMPSVGFSHRDKVTNALSGALKFIFAPSPNCQSAGFSTRRS